MKECIRSLRIFFKKISANEMARYLFFGGCTTGVNLVVFALLRYGAGWTVRTANLTSILIAIAFAFGVNKWCVFDSAWNGWRRGLVEVGEFVSLRGLAMLLEIVGTDVLIGNMHVPDFIGKLMMQFVVITVNYIVSKCFVFRVRN